MNGKKIKSQLSRFNLIRMNDEIRQALQYRIAELGLSNQDVVNNARKLGKNSITGSGLSRYFSGKDIRGSITEEDILWLCERYSIKVRMYVKTKKHDEEKALHNINHITFPGNAIKLFIDYELSTQ